MKVAIMGTRGIPASYGGFETFAEELGARLASSDIEVTVFGRRFFGEPAPQQSEYRNVKLATSITVKHKYLETPLATFTSFLSLFIQRFDIILLCNAANSPFAWIPRLLLIPVCINVDGIERMRTKWNAVGRLWYRLGELCSVLFASRIIADAKVIKEYYQERYSADSSVIAYGATVNKIEAGPVLQKFNLQPHKYILYVSRLEPENNALGVIQAFTKIQSQIPLVIVGDAPYADEYKAQLQQAAQGHNVIFTGYQFNAAYQELRSNCYFYIQATEVGGTHPALVEAMAYGNCVVANGTPENREVLGDAGLFYDKNNFTQLSEIINQLLADSEQIKHWGGLAQIRAEQVYNWDKVTAQYIELFKQVLNSK